MEDHLPPCPHLPPPRARMDWRDVRAHGAGRGPEFCRTLLEYSHYLWLRGQSARAILCLDRAFGADAARPDCWPLPYAALAWILAHTPPGTFLGNPRIHYQHLADRVNEPRREQRRWRAWGCWAITRRMLPRLPGDPRCRAPEPDEARIAVHLARHGSAAEAVLWRGVLDMCSPAGDSPG